MKLGSVLGDDQLHGVIVPLMLWLEFFYDNTNFNGGGVWELTNTANIGSP